MVLSLVRPNGAATHCKEMVASQGWQRERRPPWGYALHCCKDSPAGLTQWPELAPVSERRSSKMTEMTTSSSPLPRRLAVACLLYTLLVILFGAVVRITFSGAGCGQHWPTCQGEVLHVPQTLKTAIELTHRVTSGLDLLAVLALVAVLLRLHGAKAPASRAALAALGFMFGEVLLGAVLVLLGLVAGSTAPLRPWVMGLHLANTLLLLGALALTADRLSPTQHGGADPERPWRWVLVLGLLLLTSMSGAVTALGDTLFPLAAGQGLIAHLNADHQAQAHLLQQWRAIHPLLATIAAAVAVIVATAGASKEANKLRSPAAVAVISLAILQVALGTLNVWLSAPGWLQVLHLAVGDLLWLAACLAWDRRRRELKSATS
jgi:cytochrome c oxidase assembly protein subunit 15